MAITGLQFLSGILYLIKFCYWFTNIFPPNKLTLPLSIENFVFTIFIIYTNYFPFHYFILVFISLYLILINVLFLIYSYFINYYILLDIICFIYIVIYLFEFSFCYNCQCLPIIPLYHSQSKYYTYIKSYYNKDCPICLEPIDKHYKLNQCNCRYTYHKTCLDIWLNTKLKCPYCFTIFH